MKIFISYRRDDIDVVSRIRERLRVRSHNVFQDTDAISPGDNFGPQTLGELEEADAVLFVIGPSWLRQVQDESKPDWIRREVEHVLRRNPRPRIFPLLVRDAPLPREDQLPPGMRDLLGYQAMPVPSTSAFDYAMDRLLVAIEGKRVRSNAQTLAAGAVVLSLIAAGGFAWLSRTTEPPAATVETEAQPVAVAPAPPPPAPVAPPAVVEKIEEPAATPRTKKTPRVTNVVPRPQPPPQPQPRAGYGKACDATLLCEAGLHCSASEGRCRKVGDSCATGLPGVCQPGRQTFANGALTCTQLTTSAAETCDRKDNDCDGSTDERITAAEQCRNNADDDCDGKIDEICMHITSAKYGQNCGITADRADFATHVRRDCEGRQSCNYSFDWSPWGGDPRSDMCTKQIVIEYTCGGQPQNMTVLHTKLPQQPVPLGCPPS